jgi:hypothetical protein
VTFIPILTLLLLLTTLGVRAEEGIDESTPAKAIASLTDPKKLATLKGERASNPRLQKCLYWIEVDQRAEGGLRFYGLINRSLELNGEKDTPYGKAIMGSLYGNFLEANQMGLFTSEGMNELRQGKSATITKGEYAGQEATADNYIPRSVCPELDNQIFNLRLLPSKLKSSKGDKVGKKQMNYAKELNEAGLLSAEGLEAVRKAYEKEIEQRSAPPVAIEAQEQEAVKSYSPPAVTLSLSLPVDMGVGQTKGQSATTGQWTYIVGDAFATIAASTATGAVTIPTELGGLRVLRVGYSNNPIFGFNNTSVTSVTIPNSVNGIGQRAFFGCKSLTCVNIPNSVTQIKRYAFYGCSKLTNINIPNRCYVEEGVFYGCKSLPKEVLNQIKAKQ